MPTRFSFQAADNAYDYIPSGFEHWNSINFSNFIVVISPVILLLLYYNPFFCKRYFRT